MLAYLLVDHIEGTAEYGEEQIQTMIVRKGQVLFIIADAFAIKLQNGNTLLDATRRIVDVLTIVKFGWRIAKHPSVHQERTPTASIHPTDYSICLRHALIIAESDAGPGLRVRCLNVPAHLIATSSSLPAGVVLACVFLGRAIRGVLPVSIAIVVQHICAQITAICAIARRLILLCWVLGKYKVIDEGMQLTYQRS